MHVQVGSVTDGTEVRSRTGLERLHWGNNLKWGLSYPNTER